MPAFRTLIDICFLRARPQDLPAEPSLVWQTALLSVASNFIIDNLHREPLNRFLFASAQALLLGVVVWGALKLRGFPERWMQTIAPLYTAGALINLIAWPVFVFVVSPGVAGSAGWALLLAVGMTVWFLAVMTHIMHHALQMSIGRSVFVSIACLMLSGLLLLLLFPVPGMP